MPQLFEELLQSERAKALAPRQAVEATPAPEATPAWLFIPPALDWQQIYSSALAQLESQDPNFTANYNALSASAKEQLKAQALSVAEGAINFEGLDTEAMRAALLDSTYVTRIEGTRFTAHRNGDLIVQLDHIDLRAENATASWIQMASIVAEAIFFVIAVVTAAPRPSTVAFNRAIEAIAAATANNSAFSAAVEALRLANQQGVWALAKGVFQVILASNVGGLISQVIGILLAEVKWYQYALMALQILAYILAAFATAGAALIGKLAAILVNGAQFVAKVVNLQQIAALAPAE